MPPKKRAQTEDKNGSSNGATSPKLNKTSSDYDSLDFEVTKKSKEGKNHNFKITSWNVDGLRAWIKKGGLDFVKYEKPDVLCLQEIKCSEEKLPPEIKVSNSMKDFKNFHILREINYITTNIIDFT